MFVSHAKVRIVGLGGRSKKRGPHRRRLAVKEVVRMPCLLPTTVTVVLGLMAVGCGAGMSVVGYVPSYLTQNLTKLLHTNASLPGTHLGYDTRFVALKICSYIGPVVMAIGMFAMIVACVFYCEIMDKYAILVPDKRLAIYDKDELYEVIVGEMKKSYAQSLVTAYSKIAERNQLLENQSNSGDGVPESFPVKPDSLTLEQQIDLECEGYTPSPPIPNKSYSVIQARIQRLRSEDNWLKTSSLPNIRRSLSIRRAGRVGTQITDSRTLSYDYTMDEARLRRKSMMLRSIVHWNSGSSDLSTQRQPRYSSVKALPSHHRRSFEDISQQPGYGSFPLTRLIQRRGTFACGDMRTRRMKFLLLLEASESLEGVNDRLPAEGRPRVTGIRRNSFIPYTTCDKFISGEERKTSRDRRRSSINPFSFGNRFGNTIPQPGTRRHSFFPIRRDDKIYVSNPNEQRRHSFNPIGVNNTLKPEFATKGDGRRGSFNPDGHYDRAGDLRSLQVPPQNSRFLQVPGLDPYMEGRPSLEGPPAPSEHSLSAGGLNYATSGSSGSHDDRRVERRHSFNPSTRMSSTGVIKEEGARYKVPKITVSEDSSPTSRYLMVPAQDSYQDQKERRHSLNTAHKPKILSPNTPAWTPSHDKSVSPRISFKLASDACTSPSAQPRSFMNALKPTSEPVSLATYTQEMVVLEPHNESRSVSPCSNVSCCGSEKIWSEPSATASRAESMSSGRSAKTVLTTSPVSVVAAELSLSCGTFQTPTPSSHDSCSEEQMTHSKSKIRPGPLFSPTSLDLDMSFDNVGSSSGSRFLRKSSSGRHTRGKRKTRQQEVCTDSPTSTSSGPATLYPSAVTDANAAIHRSKSASALPTAEVKRSQTLQATFYANVPTCSRPVSPRVQTETRPDHES